MSNVKLETTILRVWIARPFGGDWAYLLGTEGRAWWAGDRKR